ncbi:chemotaxis protein CheW [Shewanella maritima]|nr:chemotaxis protein CheW [Shewanella maritima]
MSKSVDETVFDYFSLLLQEPEPKTQAEEVSESSVESAAETANPSLDQSTSQSHRHETKQPATNAATDKMASSKPQHTDKAEDAKQQEKVAEQKQTAPKRPLQKQASTEQHTQAKASSKAAALTSRPFEEPSVDKQALERLLSVVSEPIKQPKPQVAAPAPTATAEPELTDFQQQIKQSAEKVRQAISSEVKVKTAAVEPKVEQKTASVDKEINSLVDNKQQQATATQAKAAIINKDSVKQVTPELDTTVKVKTGGQPPQVTYNLHDVLDDEFQVLFFNVAGLTLAVPLVSLGGIVKVERINNIIGRPKWFMGVQPHRDGQINVVDSGAWVMPEKYTPELAESVDYQYIVMLEDSDWGLTCESLVNAVKINKSHVNWREKPGKRPWLAGVVKEQMCGILHVKALIEMLEAGLGSQDPID